MIISTLRFTYLVCRWVVLMGATSLLSLHATGIEDLLQERLDGYPLTPDNQHRLSAWAELRGVYLPEANALHVAFGDLGNLAIFPNNLLLKTARHGIYHLDRRRLLPVNVALMNEALRDLFEQVPMLGNHAVSQAHIYFVDEHLMRKNLEPFQKLYLRHVLIRYGEFDPKAQVVEFRSAWLDSLARDRVVQVADETGSIKEPMDPVYLRLDLFEVRGFYLQSGGTVYVEDVERDVRYASGESYSPNVLAFKVFLQQLLSQSSQQVVRLEENRVAAHRARNPVQLVAELTGSPVSWTPQPGYGHVQQEPSWRGESPVMGVKPLYTPQDWMGRMLGLLRLQDAVIDLDVASFLVDQAFFPQLYGFLTAEEKRFYDRITARPR